MLDPLACVMVLAAILCCDGASAFGQSGFKVTTKRDNDKVEICQGKDELIVSVHSPFGISQAVVERTGNEWPRSVALRLHLKGLEHFKVVNGVETLQASVSSHGDHPVRIWMNDEEASALDAQDPYWMDLHWFDSAGEPVKTIPLIDGYFGMRLPKALFDKNPQSITISWIDFYR